MAAVLGAAAGAVAIWGLGRTGSGWLVLFALSCGAAVLTACANWAALIDTRSMGPGGAALPGRRCGNCGTVTRIRPWSR